MTDCSSGDGLNTSSGRLRGKIVAGESAGANVLCAYFYSPHSDSIGEGLGFVPFKIIPHYRDEHAGKLDSGGAGLETLYLRECEFKVVGAG